MNFNKITDITNKEIELDYYALMTESKKLIL
jgi:hypothetical protein